MTDPGWLAAAALLLTLRVTGVRKAGAELPMGPFLLIGALATILAASL
ncbi:hypothetical protein HFP15_37340 [Amycolatopsis sp. K13G38]|uniref:Prepilin peptidase n=1 Tax=Amycolatopsis acididurans TaxID=2724524 RepID=A0ABX1JFJ2_9PSEU|nr:hypothetical protein [Amycolatopsis acididurans]NKQ58529.1 hypothetical protein [Amycolatopsis acididurans]